MGHLQVTTLTEVVNYTPAFLCRYHELMLMMKLERTAIRPSIPD
jgi:hypothetical protein